MTHENFIRRIKRKIFAFIRLIGDKIRGIDYSKEIVWNNEDMKDYSRYSMSTHKLCRAVKRYLKDKDISHDSIIDVGCGKGRMMEFLSKVKGKNGSMFTKVDGVDFSKELCNIADDNMKKLGIRSKAYHSDASTFNMYHNYTYFYMFNPVKGAILKRTIKKIIDSTPVTKRGKIRIIYCNPWSEEILLGQGFIVDKNLASYAKAYKLQV